VGEILVVSRTITISRSFEFMRPHVIALQGFDCSGGAAVGGLAVMLESRDGTGPNEKLQVCSRPERTSVRGFGRSTTRSGNVSEDYDRTLVNVYMLCRNGRSIVFWRSGTDKGQGMSGFR
jgi:hypothetical protein